MVNFDDGCMGNLMHIGPHLYDLLQIKNKELLLFMLHYNVYMSFASAS